MQAELKGAETLLASKVGEYILTIPRTCPDGGGGYFTKIGKRGENRGFSPQKQLQFQPKYLKIVSLRSRNVVQAILTFLR